MSTEISLDKKFAVGNEVYQLGYVYTEAFVDRYTSTWLMLSIWLDNLQMIDYN